MHMQTLEVLVCSLHAGLSDMQTRSGYMHVPLSFAISRNGSRVKIAGLFPGSLSGELIIQDCTNITNRTSYPDIVTS